MLVKTHKFYLDMTDQYQGMCPNKRGELRETHFVPACLFARKRFIEFENSLLYSVAKLDFPK